MKRTVIGLVVIGAIQALPSLAFAQTADEVIEKHLAAIGGKAALGKLTSQVAIGTVVVTSQAGEIPGSIEISRKVPNKARTLMTLDLSALGGPQMVVDQRCDGKSAFVSNSLQGDREITGNQLQGMLNNQFPSLLLNYKDSGASVAVTGKETIAGRPVIVLAYTPKAGPGSRLFLDAETFLIVRSITTVTIPELGGEVEQTSDLGDYRDVGGSKLPFSVTMSNSTQTVAISLSKVELNKPIDDATFGRPGVK